MIHHGGVGNAGNPSNLLAGHAAACQRTDDLRPRVAMCDDDGPSHLDDRKIAEPAFDLLHLDLRRCHALLEVVNVDLGFAE